MKIAEFVEAYKANNFTATRNGIDERSEWIRDHIEVKSYIPFREKRQIAEMVVEQNIEIIDGIKKYNSIDAYIGLVMASIVAHTNLECSSDPIADYDLLAESGLLPQVIVQFQESHNEIDILLKMALASELEDNQPAVLIGNFLNAVLKKLDMAAGALKDTIGSIDLDDMFNEENITKVLGFLNNK